MNLTKIGPNKIEGESGFTFWMPTPFQLHYSEGDHEVIVPGEMLSGDTGLLVSVSTIARWNPPHDREIIAQDKKEEITSNIEAALKFMGIRAEFD